MTDLEILQMATLLGGEVPADCTNEVLAFAREIERKVKEECAAKCNEIAYLTDGLERCGVCGEELFDGERDYCEDCRESGDLEDVLERCFEKEAK